MTKLENNILLYHGSDSIVKEPDLNKCKSYKDFGKGFYLSFEEEQAKNFANLVMKRNGSTTKFVNIYKLLKFDNLNVLIFDNPDEEWFKFVCNNRRHDSIKSKINYDIVIGKIADDATSAVINDYLSDVYGPVGTKKAIKIALSLLLPNRLNDQICFLSNKAIKQLSFVTFKDLKNEQKTD